MGSMVEHPIITVGVLALQGAFNEHTQLLRQAAQILSSKTHLQHSWKFLEVRTVSELALCDALIIPGGESTAISLVAQRSHLLEPLRDFVRLHHKPTWGTCAGLILLAEIANGTKSGGQELIGGLDVRVTRNHFGRQKESFVVDLDLPFLWEQNGAGRGEEKEEKRPFKAVFIRAPIVEGELTEIVGCRTKKTWEGDVAATPERERADEKVHESEKRPPVEILAKLKGKKDGEVGLGDIIVVRQGNCFGTSFHPELTGDPRIHVWWLGQVLKSLDASCCS